MLWSAIEFVLVIDPKEQVMSKVEESESKKPGFWDVSPISPPWTIAAVFLLIIFCVVLLKISLGL